MNNDNDNDTRQESETNPGAPPAVNLRRRRFTAATLAAPAILSVHGRSAWATGGNGGFDCSLSGLMSGNASPNGAPNCKDGYGCTPGYWRNNVPAWNCAAIGYGAPLIPGKCIASGTPTDPYTQPQVGDCGKQDAYFDLSSTYATTFQSVFGCAPGGFGWNGWPYAGEPTLMGVLHYASGSLAWHAVAAFLNAACSMVGYGYSWQTVRDVTCAAMTGTPYNGMLIGGEQLKNIFDYLNNRGCPLNAHGACNDGFQLVTDPYGVKLCVPASVGKPIK